MIRLVTRGRFSHDFVKAIIGAPEDREPVVRKLIEGAGGKVISYYVTTGETDFLLISEANEAEAVIAALMAASGAGTISHVSTSRAWTTAEFKGIAERGQSGHWVWTAGQALIAEFKACAITGGKRRSATRGISKRSPSDQLSQMGSQAQKMPERSPFDGSPTDKTFLLPPM